MQHTHRRWTRYALIFLLGSAGIACRSKPPGTTSQPSGSQTAYDPRKDPLVNPPSLLEPPPEDRTRIADDETLIINLDGAPQNLSPIFGSSAYEFRVTGVLFDDPFTFDKKMEWHVNDEWTERYEEAADHLSATLKLKPGLKWHDGHPLTAHDIAFSWKEILDDRVPCPAVKTGTDEVTNCEALDDLTVRYTFKAALPTSKWNVLFPIIPKHLYEKDLADHPDLARGDYYAKLNREPVGSGPYKFVRWVEGDKIEVERWEDYPGKKPHFKRIIFRIIPDSNAALITFEKGEIDDVRLSPKQFAVDTVGSRAFSKIGYKALGTEWAFYYIGWNMDGKTNPFFNDVRVRRAMSYALNVDAILARILYNLYERCQGVYHPDSWMYNPEVKDLLIPFDLEEAGALLDAAGWRMDPKTGWRFKTIDGNRVRFEFTLLLPQGSETAPKVAALFQQDLQRIGVRMKTQTMEWASFMQKTRTHAFQASMAGWGTGTDPDTGWNLWRTEEYKDGRNYGGYSNPRVDALFAQGRKEFDPAKRRKIYQEIHKILYIDQPYTFIYNRPTLWGFNRRIRGVQFSPRGVYNFDPSLMAWWVARGEAKYVAALR